MTHSSVPVPELELLPPPLGEGWGGGSAQMDTWHSKIIADFRGLKVEQLALNHNCPPSLPYPNGERSKSPNLNPALLAAE
jgi:hypothetical protein